MKNPMDSEHHTALSHALAEKPSSATKPAAAEQIVDAAAAAADEEAPASKKVKV